MSKKGKAAKAVERRPPDLQDGGMTMEQIIAQMVSLKDNVRSFLNGNKNYIAVWQSDIKACDAVISILTALQAEDINDAEQARDLVTDYNALAKQYQEMHRKFEVGGKPEPIGGMHFCPACHRRNRPGSNHCWNCGKRLDWG